MTRPDADVLIAGGGLAAQRCCETLRRRGFDGRIVMLCEESRLPYDRPPLSKATLTEEREPHLAFRPAAWYQENDVELLLGVAATDLDVAARRVSVHERRGASRNSNGTSNSNEDGNGPGPGPGPGPGKCGSTLRFGRLVIATGSRPRRLPGVPLGSTIHELRTHADALALRGALREREGRLAVLGAGLVGMEVASSARALGLDVTLIEAAPTPLARALPPALGRWITRLHHKQGVDVRLATTVERVGVRRRVATLDLSDGSTVRADTVLVAAGTTAATEWLSASGLGPGPIPTDHGGRTRLAGVYAAGDAACFPDPYLGERTPTPHWEAAASQGAAVARSILGLQEPRPAPAMFWSDQHGRRIQLVGHAPPQCEIELDGDPDSDEPFTAWIRHGGLPAAALLVNRPDALPGARQWIAGPHPSSEEALRAA
jgi:3-phenylpropionate/trans-cinnamate dioxygenase ferredoxin reductase subunit